MFDGTKVTKPSDVRKMLAAHPDVFLSVFTKKLMTYALGRGVEYYDMPTIRAILRESSKNDYKFSSILMGVIKSAPFQMKVKRAAGNVVAGNVVNEK
jgi:hypothetical protein